MEGAGVKEEKVKTASLREQLAAVAGRRVVSSNVVLPGLSVERCDESSIYDLLLQMGVLDIPFLETQMPGELTSLF